MKPVMITSGVLTVVACLLSGCGQSPSSSNESAKNPTPATPPPSATITTTTAPPTTPVTSPTDSQASSIATPAAPGDSANNDTQAAAESVSQFAATASAQPDKTAASVGSDLVAKARSLTQSAAGNTELKTQVSGALQSLSAGKDASALTSLFQQAKQANLTPQQSQLVKDVSNLASAYVVQRNFSSVDNGQGDVATIVNSLRQGSITPALPALKSLAQNASLTPKQKDLLGTLADQYAPGLKKASDSLKQGLQSIPGFGK